jgi:hypothetical protein
VVDSLAAFNFLDWGVASLRFRVCLRESVPASFVGVVGDGIVVVMTGASLGGEDAVWRWGFLGRDCP